MTEYAAAGIRPLELGDVPLLAAFAPEDWRVGCTPPRAWRGAGTAHS